MMAKKVKQINNLQEFRQGFMTAQQSLCATATDHGHHTSEQLNHNNFFQVAPLEKLRALMKSDMLGSTKRSFYTIVLITAGNVKETIGFNSYEFGANMLYFIPENQLHTISHWSKDLKGFHCIFDADYFLLCLRDQVRLSEYPFFQPEKDHAMKLSDLQADNIVRLFEKMSFEYCARKTHNDDLLVRLYLNVLLIEAERIYKSQQQAELMNLPKKKNLVSSFRLLVAQHYLIKRQVMDYAELLYVTPHYINDSVREETGKPASEFIRDYILSEAKSLLIQTSLTVAQVSAELNFSEQSYFGRFFKKHTGLSPAAFRKQHLTQV
ncbi:transcriptional regulator, AraC family protein [Pedobacter sp. BAL39]|uniref:helix-turn-helix domain-containing protein n=1 Tax=Pedobacter sp. BAL39 TaxID=391596 RepID=UPI000155AA16|nr:helix-turn-helix domain-containing protein [Pedobacter sp. BAL39]EDM34413.1 transcriptional regulator, AraC family protein [Pedobacter sp. BAL39]